MTALPATTVQPTAYRVSLLPDDFPDGDVWALRLESRGEGLWSVRNRSAFLGTDGSWSWGYSWNGSGEPTTDAEWDDYNAGEDAWKAEHRFDLDTARELAIQAAPHVTVMGRTAADALRARWQEEGPIPAGGNAEDCPQCTNPNPPYPFLCPGHPAGEA